MDHYIQNSNLLRQALRDNPYACNIYQDTNNSGIRHAKFYFPNKSLTISNIHPGQFDAIYFTTWETSADPQKYGRLYPVAQTPFDALCVDVNTILDIEFKLLNEIELTAIVTTRYGQLQKIVDYSSAPESNNACIKKHILRLGDYLLRRIRRNYTDTNNPLYVKYRDTYLALSVSP